MNKFSVIFLIPVFLSFYLVYSIELLEFSTSVSSKVVDYADEMSSVTQCVLRGNLLEDCSSTLEETNFNSEIKDFNNLNDAIIERTSRMLEQVNLSKRIE